MGDIDLLSEAEVAPLLGPRPGIFWNRMALSSHLGSFHRRPGWGFALALSGGVLFGLSGTVAAGLFSSMGPAVLNQYRLVLAAVLLSTIAARKGLMRQEGQLGLLMLLGVITALVSYAFYVAVERLGVGPGITIQYLGPILMLGWRRLAQRLPVPTSGWLGAGAALGGIGLITGAFTADYADPVGVLAGLTSALCYAALTITAEKLGRTLHPLTYSSYALTIASVLSLAVAPVEIPDLSLGGWMGVVWVGVIGMGIAYLLLMSSVRHISPGPAGVAGTSEPIVGTMTAWMVLGQVLSASEVAGVALTAAGIAVVQWSIRRSPGF